MRDSVQTDRDKVHRCHMEHRSILRRGLICLVIGWSAVVCGSSKAQAQTVWPKSSATLPLQARETLFDSRWGRLPTDVEMTQAQERLTHKVLLAEPETTTRRDDNVEVISKRQLQDVVVKRMHALNLTPGESGYGINQVLLVANYRVDTETQAPNAPPEKSETSFQSVFRLIAMGHNRDQFEFQFEFSQPGSKALETCQAAFAASWIDFSGAAVASIPSDPSDKDVSPPVPVSRVSNPEPVPDESRDGQPDRTIPLPQPMKVSRWLDGKPRSLGLYTESAGRPAARALGIESPAGAVITRVALGSSAEKAGLQAGDLITTFNSQEIDTLEDLEALVLTSAVGSRQKIRVDRAKAFMTVDTEVVIRAGDSAEPALAEYAHPTGGWRIRMPPLWKVDPYASRDAGSDRVYDLIKSTNQNYQWRIYHESRTAEDETVAFNRFVTQARGKFNDLHVGRVQIGNIPVVFVAGPEGDQERHTLYQLALIVAGRQYDIDVYAHPLASLEELPQAIGVVLGTLNDG